MKSSKILAAILYVACLGQVLFLINESKFMYTLRPAMEQYVFFEVAPPIRNIIATSLLYIYLAPLIPAAGLLLALNVRFKNRNEMKSLALTFLVGIGLTIFSLWFEINLFEGVSFLG